MLRSLRACGALLLLLVVCSLSSPVRAADDLALLWQNKPAQAATEFRQRVQRNPTDAPAFLGLALIATLRDAPLTALPYWEAYFRLAPGSWQAQAYWPQLVDCATQTAHWDALNSAARSILAAPTASPSLRASAQLVLARAALRAGKRAEAEADWASLGNLRKWNVIGPFENVSGCGFANVYPPEREQVLTQSYPGLNDIVMSWHGLQLVAPDGRCHVEQALGSGKESVFYAAAAVKSATARPAQLCFDPSGASKVFLNGELVLADEVCRLPQPFVADPYRVSVTLRAGVNTVLVKLASNEYASANFSLRFTTPSGGALPLEMVDPWLVPSCATRATTSSVPVNVTVSLLRALPSTPAIAWALGDTLRATGDYPAALDTLRAALTQTPTVGVLHWALSQTLASDGQEDEARAEREQARTAVPGIVAAELEALREEQKRLKSPDYLKRVKALTVTYADSPSIAWALVDGYEDAEMEEEQQAAARVAVRLAPGEMNVSRALDLFDLSSSEGQTLLALGLRLDPIATSLLASQADQLETQGKSAQAMAIYQRLLTLGTPWPHYREPLVDAATSAKNYALAASILDVMNRQCPQSATYCIKLGDTLRNQGHTTDAVRNYNEALRLDPERVELREKINTLTGTPSVLAQVPATPAEPILASARNAVAVPGVSALVLLDEARQIVYPDYASELHAHIIMKIIDAAGAKQYANFPLAGVTGSSDDTVESARVLKKDGKVQDVTKNSHYGVEFPSLEAGDIIDVSYHINDYHQGGLAKQFWATWSFSENNTAVLLSRYVLITPTGLSYQTATHGTVLKPTVTETKGWRIAEWRTTEPLVLRDEPMAPDVRDRGNWLDISTIASWRDIVRWYRDLSGPLCVPDAAIRAKAAELTKTAKTEEEKLRAVIAFVAHDIQYQSTPFRMSAFIPTKGKQVISERYGDCKDKAALLTALLAALDIKAEMVLLSGRDAGLTPYLPSPRFNHAITRVHTAQGPLWVDATADQMAFGLLPADDQGVPALIIHPDTVELAPSPVLPADKSGTTTEYRLTLSAAGNLRGTLSTTLHGNHAWMVRSMLQQVPEASYDIVQRKVLEGLAPNTRFDLGAFEDLTVPESPVRIKLTFHADNYATIADELLLVRLPWQAEKDDLTDTLNTPQRVSDAEIAMSAGKAVSIIRLELPAGYTPQNLKPELAATSSWGHYRLTYTFTGNVLTATLENVSTALRLRKAELADYQAFYADMNTEIGKQLIFKKTGTARN